MKSNNWILMCLLANLPLIGFGGAVSAEFEGVEEYTDFSVSGLSEEKTLPIFQRELAEELERIGSRYLAEGETLALTFTDIDMAGDIQPWRNKTNSDIRYVEAIYPPRLKFRYVLADTDGAIIKEGEASVSDLAFQMNISANVRANSMSFFYELELLSDWARNILRDRTTDSGSE